jgi:2-polyprenyl-6-methoxyphenol hydroxylase-like FAD-dependent oxidoreductase
LLESKHDEFRRLQRREPDEDIDHAVIDVGLSRRIAIDLHEERIVRLAPLERAGAELRQHEGADIEPEARPEPDIVRLEDGPLGALEDRHRAYVVDGRPLVTGMVPVGDAWACTNPSLGRGVSTGLVHALALRSAKAPAGAGPTTVETAAGPV